MSICPSLNTVFPATLYPIWVFSPGKIGPGHVFQEGLSINASSCWPLSHVDMFLQVLVSDPPPLPSRNVLDQLSVLSWG